MTSTSMIPYLVSAVFYLCWISSGTVYCMFKALGNANTV